MLSTSVLTLLRRDSAWLAIWLIVLAKASPCRTARFSTEASRGWLSTLWMLEKKASIEVPRLLLFSAPTMLSNCEYVLLRLSALD